MFSPPSSMEPPAEKVRAVTEKSGVVLPDVASTGRIGTETCNTRIARIAKATFLSDICHSSSEGMDLY